jgi:hypothetical protein
VRGVGRAQAGVGEVTTPVAAVGGGVIALVLIVVIVLAEVFAPPNRGAGCLSVVAAGFLALVALSLFSYAGVVPR